MDSVGDYHIEEKLGEGVFGEVFKGRKNGDIFAIKKISADSSKDRAKIAKEVAAMKNLKNPNVVRLIDSLDENDAVFIVMEFCNVGDLNRYILKNRSTFPSVRLGFINQLANGVRYLHANNIVHRDIKPDNVMIHNNGNLVIKIADFGLAIVLEQLNMSAYYQLHSTKGPKYYSAPEVLDGRATMKSDIFSMGCLIMALFAGTTDDWGAREKQLLVPYIERGTTKKTISDATEDEKRAYVGRFIQFQGDQKAFQDLVYDMVEKNWRDRPDADKAYQRANKIIG